MLKEHKKYACLFIIQYENFWKHEILKECQSTKDTSNQTHLLKE